ncbi:TPA: morphogenetic protein [Raoultella ornithinolytica]|nr:morphogenetic protein [Raoultella ornithinolytica]
MKERGMIFNGEMVRAILDGRKTQTRRPVKFPVHDKNLGCELSGNELAGELSAGNYLNSAFGKPGDRIWVREAYRFPASLDDVSPTGVGEMAVATGYRKPWAPTFYEFTGTFSDGWKGFETPPKVSDAGKLRPSIHMPRWASRILLEITDVRVERLNSISQEDAQAEGLELTGWRPTYSDPDSGGEVMTPYDNFAELWSSIYGDESWQANPWVWVIEFKRVEGGAA